MCDDLVTSEMSLAEAALAGEGSGGMEEKR